MPGKTRDCTLAQNIMFKYKLVGFEFYEAMHKELSLLLTPAIKDVSIKKNLLFDILQCWDNTLERNKDLRENNMIVSGIMRNINNNGEGEREKIIMEFSFKKKKNQIIS